ECSSDHVKVLSDPREARDCDFLILPGVGAFAEGMQNLRSRGWTEVLEQWAQDRKPLMGICLGMQLLASEGTEGGSRPGLGFIAGKVQRFEAKALRVPHMGWNEVHRRSPHSILQGVEQGTDFYFVHSYHFVPESADSIVALTPYGSDFVSVIQKDTFVGV